LWSICSFALLLFHFWDVSPIISNYTYSETPIFAAYGESILNGQIPYQDFYENKGPVWIFLHTFFQFLSPYSFLALGVILFLLLITAFYLSFKIGRIFLSDHQALILSLWVIVYLRLIRQNTPETELFATIPILFCLLFFLKLLTGGLQNIRPLTCFFNGVLFALVFWMKYQLIGIWAGAFVTIAILLMSKKISLQKFLNLTGFHLLGFLTPSALILIYFWLHNALPDLIYCYFASRYGANSTKAVADANVLQSASALSGNFSFALYLVTMGILALVTLFTLCSKKILSGPSKIFIIVSAIFNLLLVLAMAMIGETESFGTRNFAPIICLSLIGCIWFIKTLSKQIHIQGFFPVKYLASIVVATLIYLSGIPGTLQAQTQYIWDKQAQEAFINGTQIPTYKNGPEIYKLLVSHLNENYPNHSFRTFDMRLTYYLGQTLMGKYNYCPPNPTVCQLYYSQQKTNIENGHVEILFATSPIVDGSADTSVSNLKTVLTDYYKNSEIDPQSLQKYHPILAVEQYNKVYVLYLNNSVIPDSSKE
jgi:hypothetical protein